MSLTPLETSIQQLNLQAWNRMIGRLDQKRELVVVELKEPSEALLNIVNDEGVNVTSDPVGPLVD